MRRKILALLLVIGLASCANDPRSAGTIIGDTLAGFAGPEYLYLRREQFLNSQKANQQEQQEARQHELEVVFATFRRVFEETDNPFEARRQAKLEHVVLLASNPELSRQLDTLTAIMWVVQGGEDADAVCYMRGFQFGTAHHDQCVYEVKMEGGTGFPATATPFPASQALRPLEKSPLPPTVARRVEQGGKVYDPSECIGPVIMGRCHGQILPNKAYHPTCHGTWLNGHCTGPMF